MSITRASGITRALWRNAAAFAVALLICIAFAMVDARTVQGEPVWIKPGKFALSFGVHLASLAIVAAWSKPTSPQFVWSSWAVVATAWLEFALIALQAARGTRSHFNIETPFDAAIFTAMGIGVGVLFLASIAAAVGVLRHRSPNAWPSIISSVAILAGAIGSLTAMAMIAPTDAQIAGFEQGIRMSSGARYPNGGEAAGLQVPILGWSLERGDYRIAHFFGVHMFQVLLLWGWLLGEASPRSRAMSFAALTLANAAAVLLLLWIASKYNGLVNAPPTLLGGVAFAFLVQPVIAAIARTTARKHAV